MSNKELQLKKMLLKKPSREEKYCPICGTFCRDGYDGHRCDPIFLQNMVRGRKVANTRSERGYSSLGDMFSSKMLYIGLRMCSFPPNVK